MNEANEKYLFENFLFFKPDKPITESLMKWGFTCGDGWFKIVKELCEKLQALNLSKDFEVIQVKEKFGGLRFYVNGVDSEKKDEVKYFIREAQEKSFKTCEDCGKKGKPNKKEFVWTYISTLCKKCRKKEKKLL